MFRVSGGGENCTARQISLFYVAFITMVEQNFAISNLGGLEKIYGFFLLQIALHIPSLPKHI
jgi:hypothetical protein